MNVLSCCSPCFVRFRYFLAYRPSSSKCSHFEGEIRKKLTVSLSWDSCQYGDWLQAFLIQVLIQWVLGSVSSQVKQPKSDADHSPPFRGHTRNTLFFHSTSTICLYSLVLQHKGNVVTFITYVYTQLYTCFPMTMHHKCSSRYLILLHSAALWVTTD